VAKRQIPDYYNDDSPEQTTFGGGLLGALRGLVIIFCFTLSAYVLICVRTRSFCYGGCLLRRRGPGIRAITLLHRSHPSAPFPRLVTLPRIPSL
jgi:hypothetical protein